MIQIQKFRITDTELIGVDEVGRGSLIGPVITCAVYIGPDDFKKLATIQYTINDSKKLSKKIRKQIVKWINTNNIKYHIGSASILEIDELNIREANNLAMNRAIINLLNIISTNNPTNKFTNNLNNNSINCYIDGNYFSQANIEKYRYKTINFNTIVKGDATNIAIALASIIAKEYRDDLICNLAIEKQFTPYNWSKNMGYGTAEHQQAILKQGITIHHRLSFLKKLINTAI